MMPCETVTVLIGVLCAALLFAVFLLAVYIVRIRKSKLDSVHVDAMAAFKRLNAALERKLRRLE